MTRSTDLVVPLPGDALLRRLNDTRGVVSAFVGNLSTYTDKHRGVCSGNLRAVACPKDDLQRRPCVYRTLYSYKTPIATSLALADGTFLTLLRTDNISVTTSQHTSLVRLHYFPMQPLYVYGDLELGVESLLRGMSAHAALLLGKVSRARENLATYCAQTARVVRDMQQLSSAFELPTPLVIDPVPPEKLKSLLARLTSARLADTIDNTTFEAITCATSLKTLLQAPSV